MDLLVLGSGSPNPDVGRAGAATAVIDGASWVLVDAGRAATQRAIDAGLSLPDLVAVVLTHHHSDHLSDLATLATARWVAGGGPLVVLAPAGPAAVFAAGCLDAYPDQAFHSQASSGPSRPAVEVTSFPVPSAAPAVVLEVDGWVVRSALVDHHPVAPAVGYRIERAGRAVGVSGDTAVCPGIEALAAGVDVLVHEALLSAAVGEAALAWNASAGAVGALAARERPGHLVLTHLIPAPHSPADIDAYRAEVRAAGWTGPLTVAHDLTRVTV